MEINLLVAFLAGLVSFLAPCVVPLVPSYIGFISGLSFKELTEGNNNKYMRLILVNSLIYILGFSLVFVLLGLGATVLGSALLVNRVEILKIGGIFIIFFGLFTLGVFNKFAFTQRDAQFQIPDYLRRVKYLGPFLMGITFALAWTPCVGAILGAILTLAATTGNILEGTSLLFAYSMGLSLPFLIIALTIGSSYKLLKRLRPYFKYLNWVAGTLLIIIGILLVSEKYNMVTGSLLGQLYKIDFYRNLQTLF